MRHRHPCDRWGNSGRLGKLVFLCVRDALNAPAHPDSKRQATRKQRDLARHGARILKQAHVTTCPVQVTNRQREFKAMQRRLREEDEQFARACARRLLGVKRAA